MCPLQYHRDFVHAVAETHRVDTRAFSVSTFRLPAKLVVSGPGKCFVKGGAEIPQVINAFSIQFVKSKVGTIDLCVDSLRTGRGRLI